MLLAVTLHRIVCESIKVSVCMISASTCTCCVWLVASTCNCIYGEFLVEKKIASVRIQGANDPRNKMQDELLLCPVTPSLLLFWRSMPTSTLHGFMLTHTHLHVQKIQGGCLQWQGFQCMEIVIAASRKATEGSEVTISKSSSSRRMEVCKHMWRKVPSRVVKLLKGPWCGVSTALHVYCCTQGGCVPLRVDSRSAIYRIKCLCAPCCVVGIWLWCCYARSFTSLCFTVEWQHLVSLASFTQVWCKRSP